MNRKLEQFSFVKVNFNRAMCGTSHGTAVTHRNDRIYGRIIKLAAVFVSDKPTEKTRFGLWKKIYILPTNRLLIVLSATRETAKVREHLVRYDSLCFYFKNI